MKKNKETPPVIAYKLLKFFTNDWKNASLVGDLEEEFFDVAEENGFFYARFWYLLQVLNSLPKLIIDSNSWGVFMLRNYIIIAWRNIKKQKSFSLINISGLAIGMACCILLALYINSELSYDAYHKNGDRIYRVCLSAKLGDFNEESSSSNAVIKDALLEKYPEVESGTRFRYTRTNVKYQHKKFNDRFIYTDNSAFDIFTWPMIKGDPKTALSAPHSVVLTNETAKKYFGNDEPIGKILSINDDQFNVTGVVADNPEYTSFPFDGLISFQTFYVTSEIPMILTDWISHNFNTFVLLKPGVDYKDFQKKAKDIYQNYATESLASIGGDIDIWLQPIRDVYLRPVGNETGPIVYVYILSTVAIFVLLIACVNFMNLSTARSMNRAKEVGMRKVLGADKKKLISQFLAEALLLSTLSMMLAILISYLALPVMSDIVGNNLSLDLFSIPWLLPMIVLFALFVGLIAGSYPAFYLSNFQPAQIVQNKLNKTQSGNNFRKALVIIQFSISTVLIIGTALIMKQLDFMKQLDHGFDKNNVMIVLINSDEARKTIPVFKEELIKSPDIINASAGSAMPLWGCPMNAKVPEGFQENENMIMAEINVDSDYLSTFAIELIEGRNFKEYSAADQKSSIIVNETAVKRYGWKNPIGKTIKARDFHNDFDNWLTYNVIGVVKDFNIAQVTEPIAPMFIANDIDHSERWGQLRAVAIKLKPDSISQTILHIENSWKKVLPGVPFNNYFIDENFNDQFENIESSREIFSYFTLLAIFIACMGLFGMASFTAEKRTKEIGIRKALGSPVHTIVIMLSKELLMPVMTACLIAYPVTYFLISEWLKAFPYKTEIGISTFAICTILALSISFLTIAFQSIKAALANPVDSLRTE